MKVEACRMILRASLTLHLRLYLVEPLLEFVVPLRRLVFVILLVGLVVTFRVLTMAVLAVRSRLPPFQVKLSFMFLITAPRACFLHALDKRDLRKVQ